MEKNKKALAAYISEYAAFIALVLLVIVLGFISPEFRTASNFLNLLRQAAFNGLIAFGMTCVILSDGIDLSVGSTFALSAIICAELIVGGVPTGAAMLISLTVAFFSVVIGIMTARVLECYEFWGKKVFSFISLLPFLVPATVGK